MTPALALVSVVLLLAVASVTVLWRRALRRQRELAETVRRLEKGRGGRPSEAFFDLVAHELRSPLTAILGYQELMADGVFGSLDDGAAEPVERIGRSARHLLHLIDGVVELGRIRAGSVRPDLETVSLGVLVSSVAEAFRVLAAERGLETRVVVPRELPTIRSDRVRLVRAFDLLVSSAVKHPLDDCIALEVRAHDDGASIRIAGIALAIRETEEDPALRLGLRLAVVQGTARLLGGDLDLGIEDGRIRELVFRVAEYR